jgi:hypothetical protein
MNDDDTSDRIGAAIRGTAAGVDAPSRLHAHVAPDRLHREPARRRRGGVALVAAAGATVAAFVVLGALLLAGGASDPSVADAAPLALRAPTEPAPALDASDHHFIQAQVGGVRFPNYAYDTTWKTLGARTDTLSGRRTMTVLYSSRTGPVGYTIVDGAPLDVPDGARRVTAEGRGFSVLRRDGALVVSWRQDGRTCIVAGRKATLPQLLEFATWN